MLIKEFVSLLRNYHDAGKNASETYEGGQSRLAELSKVRNKDKLQESHNLKIKIKKYTFNIFLVPLHKYSKM